MSDTPRFTDTSTATPEEKARRVLQYLADPKEHRYFHEDGYPRHPDLQGDAKAALAVFNSLAAANAKLAALQAPQDVAGLVAHLDSLVKHTKEVADSSQICDATAERYLINASYLQDTINALLSQAAQLQEKEAECEGLRRDAERWRFLRDEEYDEHLLNYLVAPKIHRDSVDAAIDSARKEST